MSKKIETAEIDLLRRIIQSGTNHHVANRSSGEEGRKEGREGGREGGRKDVPVRKRLKENRDSRNLLAIRLVPVRQVSSMRQVQGHDSIVRRKHRCVRLEVGRGAREGLHVHPPLFRIKAKGV